MIVLDASVTLKLILHHEEYSDKALRIYKNHLENKQEILVPTLLYIEVANTLVTKSALTGEEVKKGLGFIYKANFKSADTSEQEILKASSLAKNYKTTVYDMLYAVVAKKNKAILVTSDEAFIQKTGFKFVKHIKDF